MSKAPVRATALVASQDPRVGAEGARLLADSGLTVAPLSSRRSLPPGRQLIVLLLTATGSERPDTVQAVAKRHPDLPVLVTMPAGAGGPLLRRALRSGADGIVFDDELRRALAPTAQALLAGQLAMPRALRRHVAPRALSHREKQILLLVVQGFTNGQIAHRLCVAESTVKTHLSSAFSKLDVGSRAEAAALVLDPEEGYGLGVLTPPGQVAA